VADVVQGVIGQNSRETVRLVRGSHIVVPRVAHHDKAYFLQGRDGRIIFAIPYESDFTLIGTTDADHQGDPLAAHCTDRERDYLIAFANQYLKTQLTPADVVWTYSGVRPLYDDGAKSATAATRDYVLSLDENGPVLLNIFGGKITTYRKLAEDAWDKLKPHFPGRRGHWTAGVALPGGDFPVDGVGHLIDDLRRSYPFLSQAWAARLIRAYGTEAREILGPAQTAADLGSDFGATLTEAELRWLMSREYARTAQDVVWRRSKLGLRLSADQIIAIDSFMAAQHALMAAQ
jgi:glycerol-3-phosphate dehydrogenase